MPNEKYAIWPLVMAESPKLLHSSAMDLWTRLWGRYHVPQNVFLVFEIFLNTQMDLFILKTDVEKFTSTNKKTLHLIFKDSLR